MENKGGFHEHLCPRECLLHPSAVSNKPGYFQGRLFLLIDEQTPECERNVLSKQRHWTQLWLKWDSRPEESFHTSRQKKCWQHCESVCECTCESSPAHPDYLATTVLVVSLGVDTHTHTLKPSKANSLTGISSFFVAVLKPWMYYSHHWRSVCTDYSLYTVFLVIDLEPMSTGLVTLPARIMICIMILKKMKQYSETKQWKKWK